VNLAGGVFGVKRELGSLGKWKATPANRTGGTPSVALVLKPMAGVAENEAIIKCLSTGAIRCSIFKGYYQGLGPSTYFLKNFFECLQRARSYYVAREKIFNSINIRFAGSSRHGK
jgi:hypothetical protein